MKVETTRFGPLEVKETEIVSAREGPLGLEQLKKFFIVDPDDRALILWLQSAEDPAMALPIIEPRILIPDYQVGLLKSELEDLGLSSVSGAWVYAIVTIPEDLTETSMNLKAPLVFNPKNRSVRQIVLQDNKLKIRHNIYDALKAAMAQSSRHCHTPGDLGHTPRDPIPPTVRPTI